MGVGDHLGSVSIQSALAPHSQYSPGFSGEFVGTGVPSAYGSLFRSETLRQGPSGCLAQPIQLPGKGGSSVLEEHLDWSRG